MSAGGIDGVDFDGGDPGWGILAQTTVTMGVVVVAAAGSGSAMGVAEDTGEGTNRNRIQRRRSEGCNLRR